MKKSRNTDDDFIDSVLDEPFICEPDLRPIELERRDTGITKRQAILQSLVNRAAEGDVSAAKLLLKITDNKL